MKKMLMSLALIMGIGLLTGCNDADVVSRNLSEDADNFKVQRKITFINTVSDEVLYTVEGNMAIVADTADNQLEITAQTGSNQFQKHFLGLSPTTVYIVEQQEWQDVNKYQFKITLKPSAVIPDVEVR
ncbi:beta-sandwich lipoprotein [Vagococcus sp.]